jgi:hypothetical protein
MVDTAGRIEFKPNSRQYLDKKVGALELEYSSFEPHHKELSEMIRPRRGRFSREDRNRGERSRHRQNHIVNSRATYALRVATAGMLAGTMSPSQPWVEMWPDDPGLREFGPVKRWIEDHERLVRTTINESNFYRMAPLALAELLMFGTALMTHVDDPKEVARFFTHTCGSYYIAQNANFEPDTFTRRFQMQTRQLVTKFGYDATSTTVKNQWDRGDYEQWHDVNHIVEPNPNREHGKSASKFKPFRSIYWQPGNKDALTEDGRFLSEKGFDTFPAYAPRWETTGEDIYATDCPGMTALGDIKQLQTTEKRKAQAVDKMNNPPLQGPPSLQHIPVSSLAGGLTLFQGSDTTGGGLRPVFEVRPPVQEMRFDIKEVEARIDNAFMLDLFLAITNQDGVQPKNQLELMQVNEERLLQTGPVLERVHNEWLKGVVDRVSSQLVKQGKVPPAPEEIAGQKLKLKFVSPLAKAQESAKVSSIERVWSFAGNISQLKQDPSVMDKLDADQTIDEYADAVGDPASIIRGDDEVLEMREQRAQAAAEAQQQEGMALAAEGIGGMADAAKTMSETDTAGQNLLTDMAGGAA